MPTFDFEHHPNRSDSDSIKWKMYPADVLPMWVADMDFTSPPAVQEALQARLDHGVFGYAVPPQTLLPTIQARLARLYGWEVDINHIIPLTGIVPGLNLFTRAFAKGYGALYQPPIYPPFRVCAENSGAFSVIAPPLIPTERDGHLHFTIDFEAFESAITPETKVFLLCSPHNPVGRVWTRDELTQLADICQRHDLLICSDDIHADLLLDGHQHLPIATLSPAIAQRTVTLFAPSKTYNIPALHFAFAVIENEALRTRFIQEMNGIMGGMYGEQFMPSYELFGAIAADAAYREGDEWLSQAMAYVQANRDFVLAYLQEHLPGIRATQPEGTYLMWLDCNALNLPQAPARWFVEHAKVAYNNGADFGAGGDGFIRLNLGCSRATLTEALNRTREALRQHMA